MTRRPDRNEQRRARALAAEEGITYQQALMRLRAADTTPTQDAMSQAAPPPPGDRPAAATVEAIVDVEVESFTLTIHDSAAAEESVKRAALESMLRTLTFHVSPDQRRNRARLRELAGLRPHRRLSIVLTERPGRGATAEFRGAPRAGTDDVHGGEGVRLEQRAAKLVAIRILDELDALAPPGAALNG